MTQTVLTPSIGARRAPISFALGMAAALPELGSERTFQRMRWWTQLLMRFAPDRGRATDGYDLVADRAVEQQHRSRFSAAQKERMHFIAGRGERVLRNCAGASDDEFVKDAEALVMEPLRALYRTIAGQWAAEEQNLHRAIFELDASLLDPDEKALTNALVSLDSPVCSLAEALIERSLAEELFDDGLEQLRAAADGRFIGGAQFV